MRVCAICLDKIKLWKTNCCNIYVHYHCQVKFGNECVICKKQLKCVSSTRYRFVPDYPELTPEEIEENRRAIEQLRRNNYIPLLEEITRNLIEVFQSDSD